MGERPTIEQPLLTSDALDAMLGLSTEALAVSDGHGTIVYVSPGLVQMLGHPKDHMVGSAIFGYVHPDDLEDATRVLDNRRGYAGADLGYETRLRHSSGQWVPATVTAVPLTDEEGGPLAFAAAALEGRASPEETLRRQLVVEQFTNRLSRDFILASDLDHVLEHLEASLPQLGLLTDAESIVVVTDRAGGDGVEQVARWVTPEREHMWASPGMSFDGPDSEALVRSLTEPLIAHDLRDPEFQPLPERIERMQLISMLTMPFRVGPDRGFVALMRYAGRPGWSDASIQLAESVAATYGAALHSARTEALLALTYVQGPTPFTIRTWDGKLVDCNQQYLDMFGGTREEAQAREAFYGMHPADLPVVQRGLDRLRRGEVDRFVNTARRVDAPNGPRWVRTTFVRVEMPDSDETMFLSGLEDITEQVEQQADLEWAASHDSLTGVANRGAMLRRVAELEVVNDRLPNLLVIDLDRFKLTNDSLGHHRGDQILQEVAHRLIGQVRDLDLVARLGGDEFAIVVDDLTVDAATELAERLRIAFEDPVDYDGGSSIQTISVGVALGDQAADAAALLVHADRAMYAAKEQGRNRYVIFDKMMRDDVQSRDAMERELRHAIDADQIEVHFQPEFALDTKNIVGAEALLRWNHPTRGLLAAGQWIDLAEQSGMIDELGRFALREACRQFARIRNASGDDELTLRVNISAREFGRPELADVVSDALDAADLDAFCLCLEVTETTLMEGPDIVMASFAGLHDIGVQFAIDDFGTGYSSLAYLKRYPVDALKVDRSFVSDVVSDEDSRTIVESIVSLGRALGLDVVAEGIETEDQLTVLQQLGCLSGQGWLVSPGVEADEFIGLL